MVSFYGGPAHPGSYHQAVESSDAGVARDQCDGYTQFSWEEEAASPARPALRSPGEGSHRLPRSCLPSPPPQTLWAGLVRERLAPGDGYHTHHF